VANTLSPIIPKLLAQGLMALRQMAIMPRVVNRGYEGTAGEKGSMVEVPIPSAIAAQAVSPSNTPPTTADIAPTVAQVALDQWYEAPFYMTDKDFLEVERGIIPMQASEAVKSLANIADNYILGKYKEIYGFAGTPGTTPFAADVSAYTAARTVLNKQLAPMEPRFVVLGPDAEGNALGLRAFQDASFTGNLDGIINGQINNKLGARWLMDQNIPTHTAGTGTGYLVNNGAGYAIGIKTIAVDTGTGTVLAGDIITFSTHTQTYTVVSSVGGGTVTSITFEPGLVVAVADNVALTLKASHVVNLALHRDSIAFGSRPFAGADPMGIGNFLSAVDPVSGLTLRLEVTREHKRTRFSYDLLFGAKTVRPELGTRIAG
jgi:hypothetical protein